MRCIDELPAEELKGKRVIVRAGFDIPLDASGNASDMFRVRRSAETLAFLREKGARTIVLSHIGRDPKETNAPVARALQGIVPVTYIPDLLGVAAQQAVAAMQDGDIVLLENLRCDERETGNDDAFAKQLAHYGELYVGDAFSAAHRAHASIVGIPKYLPHFAGLLMRQEVDALAAARTPAAPSFAILGGAKFETKAPLVRSLLNRYDHFFLTGALANDVFAARSLAVGASLVSKELPSDDVLSHPHFLSPIDVTVERPDKQAFVKTPECVEANEKIVDIGPDSVGIVAAFLMNANFILWNGPTGLYEDGYFHYTQAIAEVIAERVAQGARAVIGGGDTVAAIQAGGIDISKLGFISTGGGAMLEYLLQGTLPGIDALQ